MQVDVSVGHQRPETADGGQDEEEDEDEKDEMGGTQDERKAGVEEKSFLSRRFTSLGARSEGAT